MSNIRHITFHNKVDINIQGTVSLYPDMSFNVGVVYLPSNKKYYIKNIGITQTDPFVQNGSVGFLGIYHRFFMSNNPILPYLNYGLSRGDAVYFNGTRINNISDYNNSFDFNDTVDSQVNVYNRIRYFYQTQALSEINKIQTETKHDSILFTTNAIQRIIPDFYLNSSSGQYLCFSIFPNYQSVNIYNMTFRYALNFDLIQE